jgi:hypothetical protein
VINFFNPTPPPEPTIDLRGFPNKTCTVGRLVLTISRQAEGAPVIDGCTTHAVDGWSATGWCIRLRRTPGRALVVAWRGYSSADQRSFIRWAVTVPVAGRLFRGRFS